MESRVLVVFDFDWSLVNENTDTFVVRRLSPGLHDEMRAMRTRIPCWTDLMDECFRRLHEGGATRAEVEAALDAVPAMPGMLDAVRLAHAHPRADLAVVSDANSVFIERVSAAVGVGEEVAAAEVHTNPARWDGDGRLRVRRYHDGTRCARSRCPDNMCKGLILEALRRPEHEAVLYVGDGGGDYCPAAGMRAGDAVLARRGYPLHRKCAETPPAADVVAWDGGAEVLAEFARRLG